MKKQQEPRLDFEIDKLTNSIENTQTGEVFDTEIMRLSTKMQRKLKELIGNLTGAKNLKIKVRKSIN